MMQKILQQLNQEVGVKGSMIVEQDGLPAVTELGKELDGEIVAAMASSTIRSTKRALQLLNQSKFDRIILMAAHGRMVFVDLDPAPAILLAVTDKNINIDLTILAIDGAAIRIKNLLMKK
ncbi:roadblock/LC7 domain-containing protein [Candidatus Uabimicrobium amorphum]|uniref:Roadblock/LAMTOR2 domain-containing protein n=1 Tax=Uabimicrobium amorphum TaxID=2596890 RepID=A0A5S9ILP5_UABAM|nr:roadblock/LC7 domain-containing protein [Candidatus Uabimicrobium amorphum]BBM83841.1 hypothetical protein UABAM_02196 [Candidatus Uabimicrobium amorphum]